MLNSEKEKWLEILAVVITGAMKYILMDWLGLRVFYIGAACLFWGGFILTRYRQDNNILSHWGFHKHHFQSAFLFLLPFALLIIAAIIWYGIAFNATFLNWHVIPIFIFYPAWGLIQQFMMISLIAGNLRTIKRLRLTDSQVVLITSLLFALVHYPSLPLMGITFIMEIGFILVFFRWKNLWPLGLYHGWIASLLLFFVMGRDLWNELWPVI